jgi:hypothetical protein
MTDDFLKGCIKVRMTENRGLVAVMPSGEELPCVTRVTINSDLDSVTTVTIEAVLDTTEIKPFAKKPTPPPNQIIKEGHDPIKKCVDDFNDDFERRCIEERNAHIEAEKQKTTKGILHYLGFK